MIADLKPYAGYKESGLPWLGQVPGHWEVRRLRASITDCVNGVWGAEPNGEEDLICVRVADFDRVGLRVSLRRKTVRAIPRSARSRRMLRRGDLLLEKSGGGDLQPVGAVVAYDHDEQAVCSNFVARMPIADGYLPFFVNYLHFTLYANRVNIRSIKQTTGIQNLDGKAYLSELVAFPPPDEQAAVVRFLDWANRRLERTIRAKQKVIALLNEQKQAVIHRAVTRGLDPSVPLKPSGIPWLEEIPAHWEVRKLKYDVTFRGGGTPSKGNVAYWGGTIPWVSPKDMKADVIHDSEDHITERAVAESSTNLVPAGSLLMVVRSGILQRTIPAARCAREVALNQDMKAITSKGRLDLDYFVMLIRGCEKRLLRAWTKQGTTVESIEHQDMANTKIPMPPLDEQTQIVANLAFETSPLTNALSRLQREIELLREFRTRLVSDVVTGKLDVREAAVRLSDEEPLDTIEDDTDLPEDADIASEESIE